MFKYRSLPQNPNPSTPLGELKLYYIPWTCTDSLGCWCMVLNKWDRQYYIKQDRSLYLEVGQLCEYIYYMFDRSTHRPAHICTVCDLFA